MCDLWFIELISTKKMFLFKEKNGAISLCAFLFYFCCYDDSVDVDIKSYQH